MFLKRKINFLLLILTVCNVFWKIFRSGKKGWNTDAKILTTMTGEKLNDKIKIEKIRNIFLLSPFHKQRFNYCYYFFLRFCIKFPTFWITQFSVNLSIMNDSFNKIWKIYLFRNNGLNLSQRCKLLRIIRSHYGKFHKFSVFFWLR